MPAKPLEKPVTKRKVAKALVDGTPQSVIAELVGVKQPAISKFAKRHKDELAGMYEEASSMAVRMVLKSKERRLGRLHDYLDVVEEQVIERGGFIAREPKVIGSGEMQERVEIERFDGAMLNAVRGLLDDIAAEEGARSRGALVNVDARQIVVRRYELPAGVDPTAI